jgi:hypothetical protein
MVASYSSSLGRGPVLECSFLLQMIDFAGNRGIPHVVAPALTLSCRLLLAAVCVTSNIVDCTLYQAFDAASVVGRKSVFLPSTGFGRSTLSVVEVCLSSSGLILRLRFYSSVEISMYSLGKLRCNIQIVYRSVPSLASEFALKISSRDALRRRTVLKSKTETVVR